MKPYEKLKKIRIEKGLTTYELSEITGIPQSTISKIENGKRKLDSDFLDLLSKALNVSVNTFFDEFNSESDTNDSDIIRIERARKKMPEEEKETMMKVLEAAFEKYFKE